MHHVIDHLLIPLADGCRLAARIWLPVDPAPVPAVLEYLPYRLAEGTAVGDHAQMGYLADRGYAGVRVDIRGTGNSDGAITDEYTAQEQADCLEVLRFIAAQPWCDGAVGMTGASWGGFNALQVAALAPPELKAVITTYASDDRYADDVHYRGGCVLASDMVQWSASMLSFLAQPPLPEVVGDGWRERWLERLEGLEPWAPIWLAHQRRDPYWRHGSACESYGAIRCPVLAVGGWTDGYTDAVLRLLEHLTVPRRGIIGPWGHNDPEAGIPGPSIGMLAESVRWWDRWLKGIDNGIDREPALVAYLQHRVAPAARLVERPGRWVEEPVWPSPRIAEVNFPLGGAGAVRGLQQAGLDAGAWCADGHSDDLPPDQRADDGMAFAVETVPLADTIELLGFGRVTFHVAADRPAALVVVRVCDVSPDGTSLLVTRGLLNLTHRGSHEHPEPLIPGTTYAVSVALDAIAHRFDVGQRIRVAISPTSWPLVWPSPEEVTLTLRDVVLTLPLRSCSDDVASPFGAPEQGPVLASESIGASSGGARRVVRDLATGRVELVFDWDLGPRRRLVSSGIESHDTSVTTYEVVDGDPTAARVVASNSSSVGRPDWQTTVRTRGVMTCDRDAFHLHHTLVALEGDEEIWSREWTHRILRDLV